MLRFDRVSKVYNVGSFGSDRLTAVREADFEVRRGEVVALIGESGSGKSTLGKMALRIASVSQGTITCDGTDISTLRGNRRLKDYYRRVQGVFQDPFSSYNPVFKADRVFAMVRGEYYRDVPDAQWRAKVHAALETVRLDPQQILGKYPHQLSGGQLQRLLIARALLLDIDYLVADEIISMLDASTRIDVLNLLGDLKARGLGILFITHDLALGNYISDETVIVHKGSIVERGRTEKVFGDPLHPYTKKLLSSVPQFHKKWEEVEAELKAREAADTRIRDYHLPVGQEPPAQLFEADEGHFVQPFPHGARASA
ncbi:ABC transporter ATP-binding protein [Nocardiopsis ansamitocini]|uniref:Oligopeptide ABC transporter ATP-binding protein n=1 Tax=Nocardiopsis ansamitocini TaxID=1670832 RepID=A0A9W6P3A2_9ACTN|nr:ATP-binding cassette domain-containing protein [Nocardiopsis ansamitocini]GLU46238.1 oligopeptide ABC transporter ATP-binding protein [Nocardiopsis ansamitocini]